jgi:hypothetical protein
MSVKESNSEPEEKPEETEKEISIVAEEPEKFEPKDSDEQIPIIPNSGDGGNSSITQQPTAEAKEDVVEIVKDKETNYDTGAGVGVVEAKAVVEAAKQASTRRKEGMIETDDAMDKFKVAYRQKRYMKEFVKSSLEKEGESRDSEEPPAVKGKEKVAESLPPMSSGTNNTALSAKRGFNKTDDLLGDSIPLVNGEFRNYEPVQLNSDDLVKLKDRTTVMRNGIMYDKTNTDNLGKTWETIITHVNSGKPVFFMAPPAGLPTAFFKQNENATKSWVFRGRSGIDVTRMPRGQFHFGMIKGERALADLEQAGFLVVGCSGSAKYYKNNVKGRNEAFSAAMSDHERITALHKRGSVIGFIHKPSPALDLLIRKKAVPGNGGTSKS